MSSERNAGFTLMEVLVSVIIVGVTVGTFFQLLSSSMKLELKSREKVRRALVAKQTFNELLRRDPTDEEFMWEGQVGERPWLLSLEALDPATEDAEIKLTAGDGEVEIETAGQLCRFVFRMYDDERRKNAILLTALRRFEEKELSEEFKTAHLVYGAPAKDGEGAAGESAGEGETTRASGKTRNYGAPRLPRAPQGGSQSAPDQNTPDGSDADVVIDLSS